MVCISSIIPNAYLYLVQIHLIISKTFLPCVCGAKKYAYGGPKRQLKAESLGWRAGMSGLLALHYNNVQWQERLMAKGVN